jgi:hypothetical protein
MGLLRPLGAALMSARSSHGWLDLGGGRQSHHHEKFNCRVVDVLRVKQPSLVVKGTRSRGNGRGQSTAEGMRAIAADDLQWIMATRGCRAPLLLG